MLLVIRQGIVKPTCLYVRVYGEEATTRHDIWRYQDQHGIIHDGSQPPMPLRGETQLRESVQVDLEDGAQPLCRYTRIDYGNIVEVPHKSKVLVMAKVGQEYMPVLMSNFDAVYNDLRTRFSLEGQTRPHATFALLPDLRGESVESEPRGVPSDAHFAVSHPAKRGVWIFRGESNEGIGSEVLLDTGADANFISKDLASQANAQETAYGGDSILVASKREVEIESVVKLRWRFVNKSKEYEDDFLVVKYLAPGFIIGSPTITRRRFLLWLCVLGFSKQSKEQQKAQDNEAARKAKENLEAEAKKHAERVKQLVQEREVCANKT